MSAVNILAKDRPRPRCDRRGVSMTKGTFAIAGCSIPQYNNLGRLRSRRGVPDMNLRKSLAACALFVAAAVLATQNPSDAIGQDVKDKKAKKALAKRKVEAATETKPVDKNAKSAPTDLNPPAAPARPMPTDAR